MQIHVDNTHSVGLGDYLCFLSFLCSIQEPLEVLVDERWGTLEKLLHFQKILNIPDSITFTLSQTNGDVFNSGWPMKFFCDYYKPQTVNVLGQTLLTSESGASDRRFIGIASYNGTGQWMDAQRHTFEMDQNVSRDKGYSDTWPHCKFQPIDYWADVYKFLQMNNFDVIDLDGLGLSLEEKVYFMVKHCRAVIAYEGGIAHLAHMLNVPCFIQNWTLPSPSTELGDFHVELVHKDPGMYLLRDNELLNWTYEQFNNTIDEMRKNKGNNRFTNGTCRVDFENDHLKSPVIISKNGEELLRTKGGILGYSFITLYLSMVRCQRGPMDRIANP